MEEKYNGWTNRETWAAHLYLRESQASNHWKAYSAAELPAALRTDLEADFTDLSDVPGDFTSERRAMLLSIGSLWRVNWDEIARALTNP